MNALITAILLACAIGSASAQTQPSPLDLQLPQPPVRADVGGNADTPYDYDYDDADTDDTGTTVHGAFTTGVGYSKAYGNSTVNAAELDVSKHYDNGKTLDVHIDVMHSTGIPAVSPRCYGAPYCGY